MSWGNGRTEVCLASFVSLSRIVISDVDYIIPAPRGRWVISLLKLIRLQIIQGVGSGSEDMPGAAGWWATGCGAVQRGRCPWPGRASGLEAPPLPQEGQGLHCGSEVVVEKLELLSLEPKEGSQHRSNNLFDLEQVTWPLWPVRVFLLRRAWRLQGIVEKTREMSVESFVDWQQARGLWTPLGERTGKPPARVFSRTSHLSAQWSFLIRGQNGQSLSLDSSFLSVFKAWGPPRAFHLASKVTS